MAGAESSPADEEAQRAPLLRPAEEPTATTSTYKTIATSTTSSLLSREENGPIEAESVPDEEQKPKSVFGIIGLLLIGVFIASADHSLVITTYAGISSEFGALESAVWLSTSYTLALSSVQGIVGKLSDIYGRKAVLLVSYMFFAIGSAVVGLAQSMWEAVLGRVICGFGGAGMSVIVAVLITDLVPLIEVATWRSYVNLLATSGRSIGGPLGGFLADTIGWRWSFIGQSFVLLLAFVLISFKLPSGVSKNSPPANGQPSKLRRIDFVGAILLALTIVLFLGALSLGSQDLDWTDPLVLSLTGISVVLGGLFVIWEIKFAFEPVFPPALVIKRDVATAYIVSTFMTAAQISVLFSVPLYFRATINASNTRAGAYLFPPVFGNATGSILAGRLIRRTGKYKKLIVLSTLLSCSSYVLLILRWLGQISAWEALETFPGGFGMGVVGMAIFIALTAALEQGDIAMATGGMYLTSAIGTMLGIALTTSMQLSSLKWLLSERITGPGSEEIISSVISDISTIPSLDAPLRKLVIESYVMSLEYSHMISLSCGVVAFIASLAIREHPLQ